MATFDAPKKRKVVDPIMVRVELMNGYFDLDDNNKAAMNKIREILERADRELADVFIEEVKPAPGGQDDPEAPRVYKDKIPHDKGRVLHGFDLIQQAKNTMIDGILFKKATAKA